MVWQRRQAPAVIIGGKVYTLSGYEGEEYLQKVATYINNKLGEFQGMEELRHLSGDMKATLLQLNIADDYFKLTELSTGGEARREMQAEGKEILISNMILFPIRSRQRATRKPERARGRTGSFTINRG